jgi:hypothetical protein
MSNFFNIDLTRRLDQADIDASIAGGELVEFQDNDKYTDMAGRGQSLSVNDMSAGVLAAFKTFIDHVTYPFEAGALILKVDYANRAVDFSRSYVRDKVSTTGVTVIPNGTLINVRFEFAGFTQNPFIDAVFTYGTGFSTEDNAALLAAGISIKPAVGNKGFGFTNARECKVLVTRPGSVSQNYVIVYPASGTIIPKS